MWVAMLTREGEGFGEKRKKQMVMGTMMGREGGDDED